MSNDKSVCQMINFWTRQSFCSNKKPNFYANVTQRRISQNSNFMKITILRNGPFYRQDEKIKAKSGIENVC